MTVFVVALTTLTTCILHMIYMDDTVLIPPWMDV